MDSDAAVCPDCGQAVETVVVRRHKTLGAWVPVWGPGSCRNADCGAYTPGGGPVPVKEAQPLGTASAPGESTPNLSARANPSAGET
ncbi:hypothetical protein ACFV0T_09590 [Streptomyces sp. NPDC059582]|uniref:hypothetical protein n=1 Tax=Streptomyces sp. NPDC059582 TaxID=3346875 RepID=UPI003691146A